MTARATTLINDPSPEHSAFRATCREFAEREIAPLVDEAERSGVYPRQLRQRAAAAGLTGLSLPEACGGAGAGPTFLVIAIEELSRVCAGLATGLTGGLGEHLLCTVCGRVTEFRDERLERMTTLLAEAHDFSRQRHRLVIYGLCGDCKRGGSRSGA